MKYIAALLLLATPAFADEVVLRNGARFTGVVTRDRSRVHIRMDAGEMTFAAVDVATIRWEPAPDSAEKKVPRRPIEEKAERSPAAEIRERLEAEARERELERRRSAEKSRLDAGMSIELDRLDLERARLEQDRTLELRRQRLEALRPPPVVLAPLASCPPPPRERPAKRFRWPLWGD